MEKIPHTSYVSILLHLKFGGFVISYGISQKYSSIRVSVSVSDLNQNSGFGHSLFRYIEKNLPNISTLLSNK